MGGRAVEGTGLENRQGLALLVGSNPTPSATLRFSRFGWLTPVWQATSIALGVSSEALVKEDAFEISPDLSATMAI